jgi:hypothetical protein
VMSSLLLSTSCFLSSRAILVAWGGMDSIHIGLSSFCVVLCPCNETQPKDRAADVEHHCCITLASGMRVTVNMRQIKKRERM